MSYTFPCGCEQALPLTDCAGVDPGVEDFGRHVTILDRALRLRRLANAAGFLTARPDGSSGFKVAWTTDPAVAYTAYEIGLNDKFSAIVASMGDSGFHRRIIPTAAGYLKANVDGTFSIGEVPEATVPDDLDVESVAASTLTTQTLTASGTVTLTGLDDDAITSFVGLNAANQLVKGQVAGMSVAMFYENTTMLDANTPNISVLPGDLLTFTNTITDTAGLVSIVNGQNLNLVAAGIYEFSWMATVDDSVSNKFRPEVLLAIGASNAVVNNGQYAIQSDKAGGVIMGQHVEQVDANAGIWLKAGPNCRTQCGIRRLQLIIRKIS